MLTAAEIFFEYGKRKPVIEVQNDDILKKIKPCIINRSRQRGKMKKSIMCIDISTNEKIAYFESIKEAVDWLRIIKNVPCYDGSAISKCVGGLIETAYGYMWRNA